jgi:hypothetical protein
MGRKKKVEVAPEVETDDSGNVIGTENDKRLAMYNQIADGNDKARAEEFFEVDDEGNTTDFTIEASEEDDEEEGTHETDHEDDEEHEEETEEQVALVEEKPATGLTDPPTKYKITVNGVQKEVSVDELIATAQKVESADDYLREAARLNQDARSLTKTPKAEEAQPEEMDEVGLARAIQMGSEEEAVAAIRKLRSTGPSSDDLARTIDERLTFQDATKWFSTQYQDIVSDPLLTQLAIQQDNIMRSQGDQRPYVERYKDIGEGIRSWVRSKAPQPEATNTDPPETKVETAPDKKARKAAAPSVPKPASSKVAVPVEDDEEESVSDTIANMAKQRGGPQWLRS